MRGHSQFFMHTCLLQSTPLVHFLDMSLNIIIHALTSLQDFGGYSEYLYSVQTTEGETISQVLAEYRDSILAKDRQLIHADSPCRENNESLLQMENTWDTQTNVTTFTQDSLRHRENLTLQVEAEGESHHTDLSAMLGSSEHVEGAWLVMCLYSTAGHRLIAS